MNIQAFSRIAALTFAAGALVNAPSATATLSGMKITEWMYNSSQTSGLGEFVEFTNFGPTSVNFSGWSFDDNSELPGSQSLAAFGTVAPGESVIFTDATDTDFRAAWNLGGSVKVIGGNLNNLGRSDEVNLYDNTSTLVDRLTYNDQGTGSVAGPRTSGFSGRPSSASVLGANTASGWVLSSVGDGEGSYASVAAGGLTSVSIGSPGKTSFVPEPASGALLVSSVAFLLGLRRRRA